MITLYWCKKCGAVKARSWTHVQGLTKGAKKSNNVKIVYSPINKHLMCCDSSMSPLSAVVCVEYTDVAVEFQEGV
jgi:hypothetical protein